MANDCNRINPLKVYVMLCALFHSACRWATQRNVVVIPKSTKAERLKENLDVFDFTLSPEDFKTISSLDRNTR